jgi:Zn finger protein HypA/HybF involved in hydrogenase expression
MKCENCDHDHDGSYGAGRFCSSKCARGFSTKSKRIEISEKVSRTLSGRPSWNNSGFKQGFDERRKILSDDDRIKAVEQSRIVAEEKYNNTLFDELSIELKRRRVIEEQNYRCNKCSNTHWLGEPIKLELHHKNTKDDEQRESLECLCPNCHSYTDSWRKSYKFLSLVSREVSTGS